MVAPGKKVFLLIVWHLIRAAIALNSVESTPPAISGELTACIGDQISLTCSRDEELSSDVTRWTVSSPTVSCNIIIDHGSSDPLEPCDPFLFQNITDISELSSVLNLSSTVVATANVSISNSLFQCFTSRRPASSMQIGTDITTCIPDQQPPPDDIQAHLKANGTVVITWNPPQVICAASNISYDVNVIPTDGNPIEEGVGVPNATTVTSMEFNLTPDREYIVYITANNTDCFLSSVTVQKTFIAAQNAVTTTLSPESSSPTFEESTTQSRAASTGLDRSIIIVIVVIVVAVFIITVAIVMITVGYFLYWRPKVLLKRANTTNANMELKSSEVDALVYDDPNTKVVSHMKSEGGDLYAQPEKKAAESQGVYQDPNSIQHETAPTGDVYAVTEKKQKKKGPTEAELAQMYSVPDKNKGGGLNYASLDMPAGGSEAKRPAPTEYATVIN